MSENSRNTQNNLQSVEEDDDDLYIYSGSDTESDFSDSDEELDFSVLTYSDERLDFPVLTDSDERLDFSHLIDSDEESNENLNGVNEDQFRDRQGLSPERIEKFEHFNADESLVGEQCLVCMNDLEIGVKMVRLDCHVDHILCKVCVDHWFKDHKTCPTCRHEFK